MPNRRTRDIPDDNGRTRVDRIKLPSDWCGECDSAIDEHEPWCSEAIAADPKEDE